MNTAEYIDELVKRDSEIFDVDTIMAREAAAGLKFGPFTRTRILYTKPWHVKRELEFAGYSLDHEQKFTYNRTRNLRGPFVGPPTTDFPSASFAAINTTVTETNLYLISMFAPIPAQTMRPGSSWVVECGGVLSTTGAPTAIWTGRVGQSTTSTSNTTLNPSTTVATGSGLSNVPFYARLVAGVRTQGVAASTVNMTGNGYAILGNAAAAASQVLGFGGAVLTTVDSQTAQGLGISITWGTSSASNTVTCQWVLFFDRN